MDHSAQTQLSSQALLTDEQIKAMISDPSIANFSEERRKRVVDNLTEAIVSRILMRVAYALTDEDIETIQSLDKTDTDGSAVKKYLLLKVPNYDAIVEEELQVLKEDMTGAAASASREEGKQFSVSTPQTSPPAPPQPASQSQAPSPKPPPAQVPASVAEKVATVLPPVEPKTPVTPPAPPPPPSQPPAPEPPLVAQLTQQAVEKETTQAPVAKPTEPQTQPAPAPGPQSPPAQSSQPTAPSAPTTSPSSLQSEGPKEPHIQLNAAQNQAPELESHEAYGEKYDAWLQYRIAQEQYPDVIHPKEKEMGGRLPPDDEELIKVVSEFLIKHPKAYQFIREEVFKSIVASNPDGLVKDYKKGDPYDPVHQYELTSKIFNSLPIKAIIDSALQKETSQ